MYLDFVKDIFSTNDPVVITCGDIIIEGIIVKISSELVAIRLNSGQITIIKDEEISNFSSAKTERHADGSILTKDNSSCHQDKQAIEATHHEDGNVAKYMKKHSSTRLDETQKDIIIECVKYKILQHYSLDQVIPTNATLKCPISDETWSGTNEFGKDIVIFIRSCVLGDNILKEGLNIFCNSCNNGEVHECVSQMSFDALISIIRVSLDDRKYNLAIAILASLRMMTRDEEFKIIQRTINKVKNKVSTYDSHILKLRNLLSTDDKSQSENENHIDENNILETTGSFNPSWSYLNQEELLGITLELKKYIPQKMRNELILSNANVTEVKNKTFWVQTQAHPKQPIHTKSIVETSLLKMMSTFNIGDFLPVIIFAHKDNPDRPILTLSQMSIAQVVDLLLASITEKHYLQSKLLCYFLLSQSFYGKLRRSIHNILSILKPISISQPTCTDFSPSKRGGTDDVFIKNLNREINELIKRGKPQDAIVKMDECLSSYNMAPRFKSALLLKKAQTYSALKFIAEAINSYKELIDFLELNNGSSSNLSHIYTELARLQSLFPEESSQATVNLQKAIRLNKDNRYAIKLLEQISNRKNTENEASDNENLEIAEEDADITISKMIDIDITEHHYTDHRFLKNGGKSTPELAKSILESAKKIRNVDLSERYPAYLEAAKAYSELTIGSYDFNEYVEAAAYYSILKGNALFIKFRKLVNDGNTDIASLSILRDSACSYYVESLNLLSNIPPSHLLTILSNYLKLNIALAQIQSGTTPNFEGDFQSLFFNAIKSSNKVVRQIACEVIVVIGAASLNTWNKLNNLKGGIGGLYGLLKYPKNRKTVYEIINKINHSSISLELLPSLFFKASFSVRRDNINNITKLLNEILKLDFDFRLIETVKSSWQKIDKYNYLFTQTDHISKKSINEILEILAPFPDRNSAERERLLIQTQRVIDRQLIYLKENVTFYGRTFFYPLLLKWNGLIQKSLDERISESFPELLVLADPPYIVQKKNVKYINFLVKNVGISTATGFTFIPYISCQNKSEQTKTKKDFKIELPAGQMHEIVMNLPKNFKYEKAIDVTVEIIGIYQGKETPSRIYHFTVEDEPTTTLSISDIPWNDGRIPNSHMFKGRERDLSELSLHYTSIEKDKPYILYGLTRTGKSSILKYLATSIKGRSVDDLTIIPFKWDLSEAANYKNARDLWQYLVFDQIYEELGEFIPNYETEFPLNPKPRAKDFSAILKYLKSKKIYPIFMVDEFSFIKVMMDDEIVNPAFLHTLRQYSLEGLASFVYAGTYDIKDLLKDQKYGITGQLVNAIEKQISAIDKDPATELIKSMNDKLQFTDSAIEHIFELSGNIPYFIQMICKYCAYFAIEEGRSIIGYPELELVIKRLTGELPQEENSRVKELPENVFQNNMFSPADPREVNVLITSICYFNKGNKETSRGVGMTELQQLWGSHKVQAFIPKLADSIELLLEKKVLRRYLDEDLPVYKLNVDLFRRWWYVHHPDIKLEINTILES